MVALWVEAPDRPTATPASAAPLRSLSWTVAVPLVLLSCPVPGVSSPVSVCGLLPVIGEVTLLVSLRYSACALVAEQLMTPSLSLTQSVRETTV